MSILPELVAHNMLDKPMIGQVSLMLSDINTWWYGENVTMASGHVSMQRSRDPYANQQSTTQSASQTVGLPDQQCIHLYPEEQWQGQPTVVCVGKEGDDKVYELPAGNTYKSYAQGSSLSSYFYNYDTDFPDSMPKGRVRNGAATTGWAEVELSWMESKKLESYVYGLNYFSEANCEGIVDHARPTKQETIDRYDKNDPDSLKFASFTLTPGYSVDLTDARSNPTDTATFEGEYEAGSSWSKCFNLSNEWVNKVRAVLVYPTPGYVAPEPTPAADDQSSPETSTDDQPAPSQPSDQESQKPAEQQKDPINRDPYSRDPTPVQPSGNQSSGQESTSDATLTPTSSRDPYAQDVPIVKTTSSSQTSKTQSQVAVEEPVVGGTTAPATGSKTTETSKQTSEVTTEEVVVDNASTKPATSNTESKASETTDEQTGSNETNQGSKQDQDIEIQDPIEVPSENGALSIEVVSAQLGALTAALILTF